MRMLWLAMMLGAAAGAAEWQPLFDGKSLGEWKPTPFKGQGKVRVEDSILYLDPGEPLTGITWAGAFPRTAYEIRFEAARLRGNDFFASLTFPVGASHATWVTGGWGGDIVGMSSIDGWDASDNETRTYVNFENGRWYAFRLRVLPGRVSAWIDEKPAFDVDISGRAISLRHGDIKLSAPLGFASFLTGGAIRKAEFRTISKPSRPPRLPRGPPRRHYRLTQPEEGPT